ncbi:hypothetical protein PDESU_05817 [Pontiella desulfatans]|uniref:Uncharacterized protein n=1 Tax=Pontiella desulfatans TaxID=2750659 RepID=A0A6C2UCR9_PONDE|nr:hypothetical protein [Pontiella desulfatans]VGO17221.1 hypothetical protein PDESU_05817 [Pontiella desulfatans]
MNRTCPISRRVALAITMLSLVAGAVARMPIGSNFWNISWHQWNDVFANGWNNVSGDNPWNPQFLTETDFYKVLRFMDWDEINNSTRVNFSERTLKSASSQNPVAYEWMIDLCNRNRADLWLCIPHQATLDYSLQLARLVKYGSNASGVSYTSAQADPDNPPLDAQLKVYVEYSNETWNGGFSQNPYCRTMGVALGLPGQNGQPVNEYYQGWAYHVYQGIRHFEQFESVFGANSTRVIKTLAGQAGNATVAEHHLYCLTNSLCNPNGVSVDAYAIAPYFGKDVDGNDADALDQLRDDITNVAQRCAAHAQLLEGSGIELICYEGGQHVTSGSYVVNQDPEMHSIYTDYLEAIDDYVSGAFAHYVHVGSAGLQHSWGAMEYTGQPVTNAPKYHALVDYYSSGIQIISNAVMQTLPVFKMTVHPGTNQTSALHPVSTTNLVDGSWTAVEHADNPYGAYTITNLSHSVSDEAGYTIYLKVEEDTELFGVAK